MIIDVQRAAQLSKLSIPEDKAEIFEKQMSDIAQMIHVLSQVSENDIDADPRCAQLRRDITYDSGITRDEIMQNAPAPKDGAFCVPKTVE